MSTAVVVVATVTILALKWQPKEKKPNKKIHSTSLTGMQNKSKTDLSQLTTESASPARINTCSVKNITEPSMKIRRNFMDFAHDPLDQKDITHGNNFLSYKETYNKYMYIV